MKVYLITGVALALLTGCSSMNMASMTSFTHHNTTSAHVHESFTYNPASNANLHVEVLSVAMAGDPDFIPSDPNWLQVRVKITNTGARTITVTDISERLSDDTVLPSSSTGGELIKPPSMVKEALLTTGVGVGGMVVGSMLFPPAALASAAFIAFQPMFTGDKIMKISQRLNQEGLRTGPLAPSTTVSGLVFVPAVTGQTGLILFYADGATTQSLLVARTQ